MLTAREMNDTLCKEIVEVTFTKANGDERVMLCSLHDNILGELPADWHQTKVWDGDTLTVWDIEADGWRSFKASKVTSFEIVTE